MVDDGFRIFLNWKVSRAGGEASITAPASVEESPFPRSSDRRTTGLVVASAYDTEDSRRGWLLFRPITRRTARRMMPCLTGVLWFTLRLH